MKSLILSLVLILTGGLTFGQEICDNAIDDDLDGLIDLNDPDCECVSPLDIIPNPDFEDMSCCPPIFPSLPCCDFWEIASLGATEYEHLCTDYYLGIPDTPLPSEGEAYISLDSGEGLVDEYVSVCLLSPFEAGNTYELTLHTASYWAGADFTISLFGTPDCDDIPWDLGFDCPEGIDGWTLLADQANFYPVIGEWQVTTLVFTPDEDIAAIAIGGGCIADEPQTHMFIDHLILNVEIGEVTIEESGSWCTDDFMLMASTEMMDGTWQWYKDRIALIGETGESLETAPYGLGSYSVVYFVDGGCVQEDYLYEMPEYPEAAFIHDLDKCFLEGDETHFADDSEFDIDEIVLWEWDYDDETIVYGEDPPDHIFSEPGTYNVRLVVTNALGCTDTAWEEITIFPSPAADFEFIADGISSLDGSIGGCISNPVVFNDFSIVSDPSVIVNRNWYFGDGETTSDEDPEHVYDEVGTYTVKLVVETEFGCKDSLEMDILMTDGLHFLSNDTTICVDGTAALVALSSDGSPHSYDWSIPDSDDGSYQTVEAIDAPLMVYVTATNDAGCVSPMDSIYISVHDSLSLTLSLEDTLCINEFSEVNVTVTGGDGDYSYSWTANDASFGGDAAAVVIHPLESTTYCVTVNDGCETPIRTICDYIHVPAYPMFISDTNQACVNTSIEFFNITPPDTSLMTTSWIIDGETYSGSAISHEFLYAGNYDIAMEVTYPEGCVELLTQPSFVKIHPLPDPQFYATPNPTTIFFTDIKLVDINPQFGSSLEWYMPGASPNFSNSDSIVNVLYPEKEGTYTVTLFEITPYNCRDSVNLEIIIENDNLFYAPNTFTPDGDGNNDSWRVFIEGIDVYDFHLQVFNRWGEVVWESYDASKSWDGRYGSNGVVDEGVYVWRIVTKDIVTDKRFQFEGTINVLK